MLTYDYNENGSGGGSTGMKGVAVGVSTIARIITHYREVHPKVKKKPDPTVPFDIWFEVVLDVGRSFQPTLDLFGDFEKNAQGEITNWFTARKIGNLFGAARANADDKGIRMVVDSNGQVPQDQVDALIGKKISVLRYVKGLGNNGKPQWVHWDTVFPPEKPKEHVAKFQADLKAKSDWLRKRFHPEVLDGSDATFNPKEFADAAPDVSDDSSF